MASQKHLTLTHWKDHTIRRGAARRIDGRQDHARKRQTIPGQAKAEAEDKPGLRVGWSGARACRRQRSRETRPGHDLGHIRGHGFRRIHDAPVESAASHCCKPAGTRYVLMIFFFPLLTTWLPYFLWQLLTSCVCDSVQQLLFQQR